MALDLLATLMNSMVVSLMVEEKKETQRKGYDDYDYGYEVSEGMYSSVVAGCSRPGVHAPWASSWRERE